MPQSFFIQRKTYESCLWCLSFHADDGLRGCIGGGEEGGGSCTDGFFDLELAAGGQSGTGRKGKKIENAGQQYLAGLLDYAGWVAGGDANGFCQDGRAAFNKLEVGEGGEHPDPAPGELVGAIYNNLAIFHRNQPNQLGGLGRGSGDRTGANPTFGARLWCAPWLGLASFGGAGSLFGRQGLLGRA